MSLGPVATMGVLPGIAGGVRVAARAITPWRFAIELDAIALGETTAAIEEGRRSFSAQMVAVSLCPSLLERARLAAGVCAGGELARVHISAFEPAEGSGYTPGKGSASGNKLLAEALASTWLSVQVWRWLLVGASAAAIVNFTYYPFGVTLEDQFGNVLAEPEVHRMSWLSGQFELHASLELP